jgi:hypothetical protein
MFQEKWVLARKLSHDVAPTPFDLTLQLSFCRFHERNFAPKLERQNALKNAVFSRTSRLVAGTRNTRCLRLVERAIPPVRRIATLTMARDVGSNTSSSDITPNLRYSATFCDAAADGFGITSHWSPTLRRPSRRDRSGCDELPMFAHATKALMSRLPTVIG